MGNKEDRMDEDAVTVFDGFTKSTPAGAMLTPDMMDEARQLASEGLPKDSLVRKNVETAFRWAKENLFGSLQ